MKEEKEVKLIEKAIKQLDYPTPEELFEAVRGKITQREFEAILGFLLVNHHILIDKGEIVWIWNPDGHKALSKEDWVAI